MGGYRLKDRKRKTDHLEEGEDSKRNVKPEIA